MTIKEYIDTNLPRSIRYNPEDQGMLYGLPHPYIIPSVADMFQEMYYWDTYFANTGLIIRGDIKQAKNNVDNLLYMIERFGFVLNGNHKFFRCNSQPPYLAIMVREVYDENRDKNWLKRAYELLKKENQFWIERRITDCGLSRYYCEPLPEEWIVNDCESIIARLGFRPEGKTDQELAYAFRTAGESGWDLSVRLNWEGYNCVPTDLNSLLYAQESQLSYFASELGYEEESVAWASARDKRAELMRKFMKSEDGVFYDYYTSTGKHGDIVSVACFYPLYFKIATSEEAEAAMKVLPRIELAYGVASSEKCDLPGTYQWGYPNGWPPMQRIMVQGLLNYGYREEAMRIAEKYVELVERCFEQTGHLWEKYNVENGTVQVVDEYKMPAMLGWTMGVYYLFCKLLGREIR